MAETATGLKLDHSTLETYRGYVKKHIRPLLGTKNWGLEADVLDFFPRRATTLGLGGDHEIDSTKRVTRRCASVP